MSIKSRVYLEIILSLLYINLSNNLENSGNTDIGL